MSGVLQITRGSKAGDSVSQKQVLRILQDGDLSDSKKIIALKKLVGYSSSGSFKHSSWPVTFKIYSQPIDLLRLGFWGPQDEEIADYNITVAISKLRTQNPAFKDERYEILRIHQRVRAKKQEQFFIELDSPVRVELDTWYRIAFALDGPPTGVCSSVDTRDQTIGGVKFVFYQSCKQLPTLEFRLA